MPRIHPPEFVLTKQERDELESWQRSTTRRAGLVRRARVILLRTHGQSFRRISQTVGLRRRHVEKWVGRFRLERIDGLVDRKGRGRKPFFPSGCGGPSGQVGLRTA